MIYLGVFACLYWLAGSDNLYDLPLSTLLAYDNFPTPRSARLDAYGRISDGYVLDEQLQHRGCDEMGYSLHSQTVAVRVIVLTFNRAQSLSRLLQSLERVEWGCDRVDVDIRIDRPAADQSCHTSCELPQHDRDVVETAREWADRWQHGQATVYKQPVNAGIVGQWLDCWEPTPQTRERAIIVEDDIELSPFCWRWLKAGHNYYAGWEQLAGFSLARMQLNTTSGGTVETGGPAPSFGYRLVGSWGFSPAPAHWARFREWFHREKDRLDPTMGMDSLHPTKWYRARAEGRKENMWTMWHIHFVNSEEGRAYTMYARPPKNRALACNYREKGLNSVPRRFRIRLPMSLGDWTTRWLFRDHNLMFSWSTGIANFPPQSKTICLGWNAEPEDCAGIVARPDQGSPAIAEALGK
eukprot:COSAG05_NODE_2594_length_2861_cov_2.274801_1_plen_410_part_00